jgi:outer membrane lipoprotein SlyB
MAQLRDNQGEYMARSNRGLYTGAASGALSGAGVGTTILPGWGTAAGAVIGGLAGALGGSANDEQNANAEGQEDFTSKLAREQWERAFQQKEKEGERTQNMAGMNFLAQQRSEAQKDANLHAFRNAMLA